MNRRSTAMHQVTLAFLWHLHQPLYRDVRTRRMLMPWVRLHAVKDYTGMALLLEEYPEIRCTTNFSPALLLQLEAYAAGETDTSLELLRNPGDLSEDERKRLLDTFFRAHPDSIVGAFPRYQQLQRQKRGGKKFSDADLLDLQVLANLGWFHHLLFDRDPDLQSLRAKERGYTAEDRDRVVAKQREVLREVLPRWKALQPRVEISVSPFAHPIVPLLCSFQSSGFSHLPDPIPGLPDDADVHLRRASEWSERIFGTRPVGMWPSEGSVSEEACARMSRAGFRWVATDEEILAHSLGRRVARADVYRPWKWNDLTLVFRDLELSNLLSFTYAKWKAKDAARDLVRRVASAPDGSFVPIILDGENPWENYPDGGTAFLRALYGELSNHPRVRTAPIGAALEREPGRLDRLAAGSWINRSFHIWIGHEEDVRAWNLLGRARADLARDGGNAEAWESLYAAEGSDWFWWFGDDFSSTQDAEFDALFRRHLANVYRSMGRTEPEEFLKPIKQRTTAVVVRRPRAMLHVVLDGHKTDFFEWMAAGHYDLSREYGAMAGELSILADLFYGFDEKDVLFRLDFKTGVDVKSELASRALRMVLTKPHRCEIALVPSQEGVRSALDEILEVACPFSLLGISPDDEVEFYLEFAREGTAPVRFPTTLPLAFRVPTKDFETSNWMA